MAPSESGAILWAVAIVIVMITVLVLAAWATIGTARSVLQPLYRLRSRAMALASGRPSDAAPADVASPDEIGDIARAVEQTRSTISRLGGNEAGLRSKLDAMFVNLSHRGQSLVERQMRLIELLEQSEQDQERRAILFRLNRIAARMHRDSQNLLVLAGHELSSSWNQPMMMVNVIRTAVSEIEEYERVSVHAQPDIALSGPAVNDMVHLLAELIQNATSFSAVDMPVEVSGQLLNSWRCPDQHHRPGRRDERARYIARELAPGEPASGRHRRTEVGRPAGGFQAGRAARRQGPASACRARWAHGAGLDPR